MIENPLTSEAKGEIITAARESLQHLGFSPTCQVEYSTGPMYDTIRAWRNWQDRHSGAYPMGEWHFDIFPTTSDALQFGIGMLQNDDTATEAIVIGGCA